MSRFTQCNYVKPATEGEQRPSPKLPQRKSMAMGQKGENAKHTLPGLKKSPSKTA